jgi:ArsR family transcriptional regulator, arsenate/arsenite/antimonite-responsive transcriptional repressor
VGPRWEGDVDDKKLIRVLRALSDPNRFRMVQEIAGARELSCGQVVERFNLSQPTISHHMKILTEADVLSVRREGQHAFISVNHAIVDEIAAILPRRLSTRPARRAAHRSRGRDSHA